MLELIKYTLYMLLGLPIFVIFVFIFLGVILAFMGNKGPMAPESKKLWTLNTFFGGGWW